LTTRLESEAERGVVNDRPDHAPRVCGAGRAAPKRGQDPVGAVLHSDAHRDADSDRDRDTRIAATRWDTALPVSPRRCSPRPEPPRPAAVNPNSAMIRSFNRRGRPNSRSRVPAAPPAPPAWGAWGATRHAALLGSRGLYAVVPLRRAAVSATRAMMSPSAPRINAVTPRPLLAPLVGFGAVPLPEPVAVCVLPF